MQQVVESVRLITLIINIPIWLFLVTCIISPGTVHKGLLKWDSIRGRELDRELEADSYVRGRIIGFVGLVISLIMPCFIFFVLE